VLKVVLITVLIFKCVVTAQLWPRPSNFLATIRTQNSACTGETGDAGTCMSDDECARKKGTVNGACEGNQLKCCVFKFTCGQTTTMNGTVFVNPSHPRGENGTNTCQVTIKKTQDACQLRLDFEEFSLAPPDETGRCSVDSFMVRTTVGEKVPQMCGENDAQHLYIEMGRGNANPVVLSVMTNGNEHSRRWRIRVTFVPCDNFVMAPSGCLQFFRSPSAFVSSFNYGPAIDGRARYLANLRYTTCVRVEENFCAIKWMSDEFNFGVARNASFGSGDVCSNDDFIGIDQGSRDGGGPGEDRFCGSRLLDYGHVISRSKPFMLRVRSNGDSVVNGIYSQNGFRLQFVQLPCVN